jgi:hypothetical protein
MEMRRLAFAVASFLLIVSVAGKVADRQIGKKPPN